MPKKKSASSLISELKRKTRRTYSSEEKIRIIIDGMRGEMSTKKKIANIDIEVIKYFALPFMLVDFKI